jgi:hypothetical protein
MDINQQPSGKEELAQEKLVDSDNSIELSENSEIKDDEINPAKDPNLIKKIEFVLNIQEVPGKKITENYLKELTSKLKAISDKRTYIQYNFKLITESNVEYSKMMGGGNGVESTFPYNVFEGLFDRLSQKKTTTTEDVLPLSNDEKDTNTSNVTTDVVPESTKKGIFERLFSYIPSVGTITTPTIDLSFTMPVDLENLVQDPIEHNDEYDGVTHVLVTIYDKIETMGYIGGLVQLENWIKEEGGGGVGGV